ncbi:MAG: DUF2852 domain-containing protein [Pseudomonadota bacterium]
MSSVATWPSQAENWLDSKGKPAWIIAMVLGFIFFWPVGLALLFYMIWSKRMFSCSSKRTRYSEKTVGFTSSGNTAFDAYKAETLRRLQDEQDAFEAFLDRLRAAKDKSEFDQFMEERAKSAKAAKKAAKAQDGDPADA